jgi:hypothetical protein
MITDQAGACKDMGAQAEPKPNGRPADYYLSGRFSTPSKVILTGLMYPFSSKYILSIQVTR